MDRVRRADQRGAWRVARDARHWLLCTVACSLLACSGEAVLGDYPPATCDLAEPSQQSRGLTPLLIASFWADDPNEDDAFQQLLDFVDQSHYLVTKQQMRSRVEVQVRINEAFVSQQLPDVFQANGGSDVLRWVEDSEPDSTAVCALDALRERYTWDSKYFAHALKPLKCREQLYGLPVGIHHLNVLFYNRELFVQLAELARGRGVELVEPAALHSPQELLHELELVAALDARTAKDEPIVPLAVGTRSQWPLTIIAFENLLLSLRPGAYETLWMGGLADDAGGEGEVELRAALSEMLEYLRELVAFSYQGEATSWQEALGHVGEGRALFTVMGDWGWAQLSTGRSRVETVAFPGTEGIFVYTPDSFVVPRDVRKDGSTAHSFLHGVVESKEALIAFSNLKYSIPPRSDLDQAEVAELATDGLRATYRQFKRCDESADGCKLLLAVSGLGPAPGTEPCFDQMDALLSYAVLDAAPSDDAWNGRDCHEPRPSSASEAEARLLDLLVNVARRRFADECR